MGQPSSRERLQVPGADAVVPAQGNTGGSVIASAHLTRRGLRPWHVRTLLGREPGGLASDQRLAPWPAPGRRAAEAGDARTREVRPRHGSDETSEQSTSSGRATGGGVGGAKGAGRAPGPGPGKRVAGVGPHTAGGETAEEGEVHFALPPSRRGHAADRVPCAQARRGPRVGRDDMAGLRDRPRSQDRGPALAGPAGSISGAAVPQAAYPEGRRTAAPAGGRGPRGHDRPEGHGGSAGGDLRG